MHCRVLPSLPLSLSRYADGLFVRHPSRKGTVTGAIPRPDGLRNPVGSRPPLSSLGAETQPDNPSGCQG
eukprot:8833239-Heterocapsa_arctica.AAC.1